MARCYNISFVQESNLVIKDTFLISNIKNADI